MLTKGKLRTLAALVHTVDDDKLRMLVFNATKSSKARLDTGTYVTHMAWRAWSHCADRLSQWMVDNPEAYAPREESDNPRFAHDAQTRKALARLLADQWQRKHGIRPQSFAVDTADDTP